MKRITQRAAAVALSLGLVIAGICWATLRPGSPETVTNAAGGRAVPDQAIPVSLKLPPGCTFQATDKVAAAPDARPVASFASAPSGLSDAVSVEYPPCGQSQPVATPPPDPSVAGISFRILSIVRYQGALGNVYIETMRPSPVALSRGLNLGDPGGALPDGSNVQVVQNVDSSPSTEVQWLTNGLVIDVAGDLPVDQLKQLAAKVVLPST